MQLKLIFWALLYSYASSNVAGTLANGVWTPSSCGVKPEAPVLADGNVDEFNHSVAQINVWQAKVKPYLECVVREANTDNALIAEAANKVQAAQREAVEQIGNAANAAKKKLDSQ